MDQFGICKVEGDQLLDTNIQNSAAKSTIYICVFEGTKMSGFAAAIR